MQSGSYLIEICIDIENYSLLSFLLHIMIKIVLIAIFRVEQMSQLMLIGFAISITHTFADSTTDSCYLSYQSRTNVTIIC